jgi:hypothetical protein
MTARCYTTDVDGNRADREVVRMWGSNRGSRTGLSFLPGQWVIWRATESLI